MAAATPQTVILGLKVHSSDGLNLVKNALQEFGKVVQPVSISSVYRVHTEAEISAHIHDLRSHAVFEGLVVAMKGFSTLSPEALNQALRHKEALFRNEALRQSVTVSFSFYGSATMMTPDLTLPDPIFHLQPESVLPAAEISPEFVHPVLRKTLRELAKPFVYAHWGEFVAQGKAMLDF
ncbi:MAG: hypothetical protein AB7N80_06475 [Bdellovibrionales bacterium]